MVAKVDHELSSKAFLPQGFQRIEELLFSSTEIPDTLALHNEYELLVKQLSDINEYYQHIEMSDGQVLEMCQLELVRISAMNLSGYDATLTQTNVQESLWCMEGIENALRAFAFYKNKSEQINGSYKTLMHSVAKSKKYLLTNPDYNTFDRLTFITSYINPLNKLLV